MADKLAFGSYASGVESPIEMSGIKENANSKIEFIRWEKLFRDPVFNIRENNESNYSRDAVAHIYESMKRFGLIDALLVSEGNPLTNGRPAGQFLILRGNLRHYTMGLMVGEHKAAEEVGQAGPSDRPFMTVKCDVKRNLSREDELVLMLDHENTKKLSPFEMFCAVERLADLGWSETAIKNHLGFKRGEMTAHFRACKLGSEIRDAYVTYLKTDKKDRGDVLKVDAVTISNTLYPALGLDEKAVKNGEIEETMGMGPALEKAWSEIKSSGPGGKGKGHSPKQFLEGVKPYAKDPKTGHRMLLELLNMGINGDPKGNVKNLMANIVRALNEVFPPVSAEKEEIIQHEGNVTKRLGYVPTPEDDGDVVDVDYEDADTETVDA